MPDDDAPYHVELDVTAKVDELRAQLHADPEYAAKKIVRCIELLEEMHRRQVAADARIKTLKAEHRELVIQVATLASRFETLTGALQARQPGV